MCRCVYGTISLHMHLVDTHSQSLIPLYSLPPSLPQSLLWVETRRLILTSDEAPLIMSNASRYKAAAKYYLFDDVFAVVQVYIAYCCEMTYIPPRVLFLSSSCKDHKATLLL